MFVCNICLLLFFFSLTISLISLAKQILHFICSWAKFNGMNFFYFPRFHIQILVIMEHGLCVLLDTKWEHSRQSINHLHLKSIFAPKMRSINFFERERKRERERESASIATRIRVAVKQKKWMIGWPMAIRSVTQWFVHRVDLILISSRLLYSICVRLKISRSSRNVCVSK